MNKHTPGPWGFDGSHIYAPDGGIIAQVHNPGRTASDYPLEANRNLMAAAPELLEALLQANVQLDMASECIEGGRLDEARLHVNAMRRQRWAIANKATGAA